LADAGALWKFEFWAGASQAKTIAMTANVINEP
jgi:hypothetical protein